MVPEGWVRKPIKEACQSIIDCVNKTAPTVDYMTPFKMIRTTNVRNGRIDTNDVKYADEETYLQWIRRGAPKKGDIIFTREAPVGEAGVLEHEEGVFLGQRTVMYRTDSRKADNYFVFYSLQSTFCQRQIENLSNGGTVAHVRVPDCGEIILNMPPLPEQKKIAQILSTWDQAITATERLLENSQQRKKGLMQQLLTGKQRLPGFEGEWEKTTLGAIGRISSAGVDKKIVEGEKSARLLNYLDVFRREFIFDHELTHEVTAPERKIANCDVRKGDVFFTPSSETREEVGIPAVAVEDMPGVVYSYHVVRFRPSRPLDLSFAAYAFQTDEFRSQTYRLCDGSGQRYVLSQDDFRSIQITVPDLAEQKAIGLVLKAASDEILALSDRINCLKQEKKALMQQLLTGKRRVQVEAA